MKKICLSTAPFLLFLLSGFYLYYLYKYPQPPNKTIRLNYYPQDLTLKIGNILPSPKWRKQHFLNFPQTKQPDTIRIGVFGDSYTFGEEIYKTETYPRQLQELFNDKFQNKKVEVLNFAVSGDGFQTQFFLWESFAKSYELDYILFGPQGFFAERDVTFRKNWGRFFSLYHPRTRLILSQSNQLKQVHIKGNTLKKRYKNYYRLIPSWTALRYDRRPFQVWEQFFHFLRYYNLNPFYYQKMDMDKEASTINKILLEKIRQQHNKKILFFTDTDLTFDNYRSVKKLYNLNRIPWEKNVFYITFAHQSSLANEINANIYFNALTGQTKKFSLNIIRCYFEEKNSSGSITEKQAVDLNFVQSIQIIGENIPIAHLRHNASDHWVKNEGSYFNYKTEGTKSFIGLSNGYTFSTIPYIPLAFQLKEGMKIYIVLANKDKILLGSIKSLDFQGKFFDFYANYIKNHYDISYSHHLSYFTLEKMPPTLREKIMNMRGTAELFVEGYKLGAVTETLLPYSETKVLKFNPVNGYMKSFLMLGLPYRVRETDLPNAFPLYIQYNMINEENFRNLIPHWKCKKEKALIHLDLPNFEPL